MKLRRTGSRTKNVQVLRATRYSATLLEAVGGVPVLRLAKHKVLCRARIQLCRMRTRGGDGPLNSLQYAPMKKAALFKGPEVVPISETFGRSSGMLAGSTDGLEEPEGGL